jgi:hypothetical protein
MTDQPAPPFATPPLYDGNMHPAALAARRRAEQLAAIDAGAELIDGRDAIALVVFRKVGDGVEVEARAVGISKPDAAVLLRQIADRWAAA